MKFRRINAHKIHNKFTDLHPGGQALSLNEYVTSFQILGTRAGRVVKVRHI